MFYFPRQYIFYSDEKTANSNVVSLIAIVAVLAWLFAYQSDIITEQEALETIRVLPEVQEFITRLERNGATASLNTEDHGSFWSVQVYEIVVSGGESHTATFNWYRVDKDTGDVSKEF